MKKLGLISFGTGGTSGHMTLITQLANSPELKEVELYVISEYDYLSKANIGNKSIQWLRIDQQTHQKSLAGRLVHASSQQVNDIILENNIDNILFSTFFDTAITKFARQNNVKTNLITYPLRDTFSQYFFLKAFNKEFDNMFILDDIIPYNIYTKNGAITCKQPVQKYKNNILNKKNNILISCGGGGLPSADSFFKLVSGAIPEILSLDESIEIDITIGNYSNIKIFDHYKNNNRVRIHSWIKNWPKKANGSELVINEAGYFSVNELIANESVGILIPGNRRMDNQELRAIIYEKKGFGYCVLPEEGTTGLLKKIEKYFVNNQKIQIINNCKEEQNRKEAISCIGKNLAYEVLK